MRLTINFHLARGHHPHSVDAARAAANAVDRAELRVLENETYSAVRRLSALRAQEAELVLRAPHDGIVRNLSPDWREGQWVGIKTALCNVLLPERIEIRGYAEEPDLRRMQIGAKGRFLPDDVTRESVPVELAAIGPTAVEVLDLPMLASTYEGPVQVVPDRPEKGLKPLASLYSVILEPRAPYGPEKEVRGQVRLDGLAESMAGRVLRRVFGVLIRESGA